ncbi:hypothetical protein RI367_007182 [Sorochytrium milnesiophthora]
MDNAPSQMGNVNGVAQRLSDQVGHQLNVMGCRIHVKQVIGNSTEIAYLGKHETMEDMNQHQLAYMVSLLMLLSLFQVH